MGAAGIGRDGGSHSSGPAIFISCIGRRTVLKQSTEEELESARKIMGD
jgi:hypothetical protein